MKFKQLTALLVLLLILPIFLNCTSPAKAETTQTSPNLYFGVDVAFDNLTATEQLIDNVSSYTNFFVIGCTANFNLTRLTVISWYLYDKGLSFIVYSDIPGYPGSQWLAEAKNNWGNSFLGIYYDDEEGGRQIDQSNNTNNTYPIVPASSVTEAPTYTYSDAAESYVNTLNSWLSNGTMAVTNSFAYPNEFQLFTSDYALYWYDYEAGYNAVFAEFTMNYSQQLNIDLVRGAATVQNKDWGVMITWKYTTPPYMENGTDLYNDMVLAYNNGAKYIVVFDTNENYTQNVLTQTVSQGQGGQLDAMEQFWQYVKANPRSPSPVSERTAYVLPADYGYGFRGPNDKIWGLWQADNLSLDLSMSVSTLMQMDGDKLDIVYPSPTLESAGYHSVIEWNDPTLIPTPSPTPQKNGFPPFYTTTIYFYAVVAGLVAAAVVFTALKFKKRDDRKKKMIS